MFDKQIAIEKKNKIQSIAVEGSKGYLRMLLTWATGCGKSLGSLKIIKNDYDKNPNMKGYLICSESNHINNWLDDIKEHNMNFILDCSEQFLYASLHKYSDKGYVDFVILDEVHHITEKRLEHLKKIIGPKTRVVMLSATIDEDKLLMLKQLARPFGQYDISISEAIEMGLLPIPKVFVHRYKLDDVVTDKSLELKKDFNQHHTTYNLTEKGMYNLITEHMNAFELVYMETGKNWARNFWVNTGSKRKRILAELKTQRAKDLIKKEFIGCRHIVFTGSKTQAEALGRNYIHSGKTKKQNLELKDKFNKKRLTNITVVNMFREGMNLKNIEKGLIVQLDNVKLTFIQMLGRVFRSTLPEIHIIVFKDTQDEKYLNNVLKGFNEKYVIYVDYD